MLQQMNQVKPFVHEQISSILCISNVEVNFINLKKARNEEKQKEYPPIHTCNVSCSKYTGCNKKYLFTELRNNMYI